uniref:Uncharacterized protein n=1 Tax=Steinernema glaseri TaxID=37863 RepID=A0A1I8AKI3_9BILA
MYDRVKKLEKFSTREGLSWEFAQIAAINHCRQRNVDANDAEALLAPVLEVRLRRRSFWQRVKVRDRTWAFCATVQQEPNAVLYFSEMPPSTMAHDRSNQRSCGSTRPMVAFYFSTSNLCMEKSQKITVATVHTSSICPTVIHHRRRGIVV